MGKEKEFGRDLEVAVTSWMEEIDSVKSRTSFQLKFLGMVGERMDKRQRCQPLAISNGREITATESR